MWTRELRESANRPGIQYPSDLSDAEWALVEPPIPPPKHGGRKRDVNLREVLNAILYVVCTGCQRAVLPQDLAPKSTAHWDFSCGTGMVLIR